jgi:hypothetical protein
VTQYCWGDVWNRPGLERKQRSMINLAMLTALNRPHELKIHVRGALNNGLTKDEIKEVLLCRQCDRGQQYCGRECSGVTFRRIGATAFSASWSHAVSAVMEPLRFRHIGATQG